MAAKAVSAIAVQHLRVRVGCAEALAPAGDESNVCRFGSGHRGLLCRCEHPRPIARRHLP